MTRSVSYLPLSHIAEQMFSIHIPISIGYPIYFAESIEKLLDNLKEVQPTVFFGVPRVWEKFHAGSRRRARPRHRRQGQARRLGAGGRPASGGHREPGRQALGPARRQTGAGRAGATRSSRPASAWTGCAAAISGAAPIATERARVLRRLPHLDPRGLRPVGGLRPDHVQPAGQDQVRQRRARLSGCRGAARRRRRDPRCGAATCSSATSRTPPPPPRPSRTAGCTPATSARSTPRGS